MEPGDWVIWGGLGIGLIYGVTAQISGFCLNRALRDQVRARQGDKLRSFTLAVLVAMIGTQTVAQTGLVDLSESIYAAGRVSWPLIVLGGLLFGFGMILCRGCGARSLVLLGQGNLRSLLVLLCLGISAYATLTGVLGPLRASATSLTATSLAHYTATSESGRWLLVAVFALPGIWYILRDKSFLTAFRDSISGLLIGLLIVAGWLVTGWLGVDEFEPSQPASLTFVAPIGATIQYLMIATGASLNFGVVLVLGVLAGALASAVITGQFKITGFDETLRMPRYIVGGICMGVGGALALGCSVGQGLTGMSTLSFVSMTAFGSIIAGALLALRRGY